MTQPESVRRQIEEAQRLHEEVYQVPGEPVQEPQGEQQQAPDASGQVHDWKLRFTNYKANADREISTLRQSVGGLQAQLQAAVKQLEEVQQAQTRAQAGLVPNDLLSAEEKDLLGEENLAVVAKVADAKAQAQVSALMNEIKALKDQLSFYTQREVKRDQQAQAQTLEELLTKAYQNWRQVDNDPAFAAWMSEVDQITGRPREYFFRIARQSGDVPRLAAFYREYGEKRAADPREALITPQGRTGGNEPQNSGRVWSQAAINEFYAQVRRGDFRGKEQDRRALEADLFAAQREGRIR